MTITLTSQDRQTLFNEAVSRGEISQQETEFETFCEYPSLLGHGYNRAYQLRPGLSLSINDYVSRKDFVLAVPERQWPIESCFHISGSYNCDCDAHTEADQYCLSGSYESPPETLEYLADEKIITVLIKIEPLLFRHLVAGQLEALPTFLEPMAENKSELIKFSEKITPAMQVALQQIMHCPYQGVVQRVYIESKVLELLALQLLQIADCQQPLTSYSILRKGDIDCIHQAKEILLENIENPPSLLDLARQVGLNDRKLKQGFREVFDTTPFAYLRRYRLEQAQQLLTNPDIPVDVVAKQVGYGDRSSFAVAFRKQFGLNPKSYQLQNRARQV